MKRAEDRTSRVVFTRVFNAANQDRNGTLKSLNTIIVEDVRARANQLCSTQNERTKGMYVNKAQLIQDSHKKREGRLKVETEEIHKKIVERKQKHNERYVKVKEEEEKDTEIMRERVLRKTLRTKPEVDV